MIKQKEIGDRDFLRAHSPTEFTGALTAHFSTDRYISLRDRPSVQAPEHTDEPVADAFNEAATCQSLGCWNAAGAMLRLAIDLATRPLLPTEHTVGLNRRTRRDLAPRITWLIANGRLARELGELSDCIREDGNDAAHAGTLTAADVADLMDFATALFERMFTEPKRLELAKARRDLRRQQQKDS